MSFGLETIAERIIAEAVERGLLEDLEGKGRPLNLDEDTLSPPHLRLGNRILRNANVLPDCVQADKDIRELRFNAERTQATFEQNYVEQLRLTRDSGAAQAQKRFAKWYARNMAAFLKALVAHNEAVLKFNLAAPNSPTVHIPFLIRERMERIERLCPPPPDAEAVPVNSTPNSSGVLRDSTTALYRAGLTEG